MQELLNNYLPNIADKLPDFWQAVSETVQMVGRSGIYIFVIGMFLGIVMTVTKKGGILENMPVFEIVDKLVNLFRSIPFIILLAALIPVTRMISGTAIGVDGAIVPLVFGTTPFFSRQVESALAEIKPGLVEAAVAMGESPVAIIFRVILRESIPGLVRAVTITIINLISLTAMAGAVGAGGIGDFAIRFGYQRNQPDVTLASVIVLVVIVTLIQVLGNAISNKCIHN